VRAYRSKRETEVSEARFRTYDFCPSSEAEMWSEDRVVLVVNVSSTFNG